MLNQWFPNVNWEKMWEATVETLYMTAISLLRLLFLGLFLDYYYF